MNRLYFMAAALISAATSFGADVSESTATGNIQAVAGKWKAVKSSHHLLDSNLVASGKTGFEIAIDEQRGASHRKNSNAYFDQYSAFLETNGHTAIASGHINFDYGSDGDQRGSWDQRQHRRPRCSRRLGATPGPKRSQQLAMMCIN